MSGVISGIGKVASLIPGIGPIAGAGLGALGGILARPKEDPRYAAQQQYLGSLGQLGAPQTAGIDPLSQQGFGLMQKLATSGPDISSFYNPYQEEVVGGINRDIAGQRTDALKRAADLSTRDRTFGGARAGIMGATALGEVNKSGLNALANLRYGGYADAVRNAMQQQMFGLSAAQGLIGAGDYNRSVTQAGYDAPFNRALAMSGITAQQLAAGQGYQPRPGILQSALGGALTGFGLFKKPTAGAPSAYTPPSTALPDYFTRMPVFGAHP